MATPESSLKKHTVDFSNLKSDFKDFLAIPNNSRVIFSGRFGSGKTTFLKEFFIENANEYIPIHIYPINYSVASNEDIFELIKFDIFYSLLDHRPDFDTLDMSSFEALRLLGSNDAFRIIEPLIKSLPNVGKQITAIIDSLKIINEVITKKKKEININLKKDFKRFIESIENQNGSIYENDFYTQQIKGIIDQIESRDNKKFALVIDDIDRIDPEHIFRILNVFAAHFDVSNSNENKFGLSKVILSCDLSNIREIFIHRYGSGVDFKGYINKFYSRSVFELNNKNLVTSAIGEILTTVRVIDNIENQPLIRFQQETGVNAFLTLFLELLVRNGKLTLRDVMKFSGDGIPVYSKEVLLSKSVKNTNIIHISTLEYLIAFFGDHTTLTRAIKDLLILPSDLRMPGSTDGNEALKFFSDLILLADHKTHRFKDDRTTLSFEGKRIEYSVQTNRNFWGNSFSAVIHNFDYPHRPTENMPASVSGANFIKQSFNVTPLLVNAIEEYAEAVKLSRK